MPLTTRRSGSLPDRLFCLLCMESVLIVSFVNFLSALPLSSGLVIIDE